MGGGEACRLKKQGTHAEQRGKQRGEDHAQCEWPPARGCKPPGWGVTNEQPQKRCTPLEGFRVLQGDNGTHKRAGERAGPEPPDWEYGFRGVEARRLVTKPSQRRQGAWAQRARRKCRAHTIPRKGKLDKFKDAMLAEPACLVSATRLGQPRVAPTGTTCPQPVRPLAPGDRGGHVKPTPDLKLSKKPTDVPRPNSRKGKQRRAGAKACTPPLVRALALAHTEVPRLASTYKAALQVNSKARALAGVANQALPPQIKALSQAPRDDTHAQREEPCPVKKKPMVHR